MLPPLTIAGRITTSAAGRLAIAADIPVRDLAPGSYLASMLVTLPGVQPQTLTRRFVVSR